MLPKIIIRKEIKSDYRKIFDLIAQAFDRDQESQLVEALRASESFVPELSLVAETAGDLVGYILFSKIKIADDTVHRVLALGPVAVRPDLQRQGIGSMLIDAGLKKAVQLDFDSVIVLGSKDYYPKFGFKYASNWGITTTYNDPESTFILELRDGALDGVSGVVKYPREFADNNC